eukprot:TRINITY_DN14788_c0_g1_i3.p1 TRINITY_DN14788_c0_g1~~TRINITY_DN14788_c0_g1_i3.p1  ORF type:complete len:727 (+),score=88.88 TRINITY_DN14788_c0_g1_i3:1489-3669(+)
MLVHEFSLRTTCALSVADGPGAASYHNFLATMQDTLATTSSPRVMARWKGHVPKFCALCGVTYVVVDTRNSTKPSHTGRRLAGDPTGADNVRRIIDEIVWNPFPHSAYIGIIVSSLSQALQCLVVAPRLLQAMAKDRILRVLSPLAPLSRQGEPARALLCTYLVAALLVLIGDLDIVAPLLTTCFLVTYAIMNCSCFALTWLKSPAWRPPWIYKRRWRAFNLVASGSGFLLCLAIMFIVDHWWGLIALCLAACLYGYVGYKLEEREWGSAIDGIKYQLVLNAMTQLETKQRQHVIWRPQVLILYRINLREELGGIKHREIMQFYAQLRKSGGFCVVACVLESQTRSSHAMHIASIEKRLIRSVMKEEGISGFAEVVVAPNWAEGAAYMIQLTGIGGIVPNTVLLDWPENWRRHPQQAQDFVSVISTALAVDKAVLAVKGLRVMPTEPREGSIDIWWMIHDGGFLVLLSWLLSNHRIWRSCNLRVFTIAENVSSEQAAVAGKVLTRSLRKHRLFDVEVEVILADDEMIEPYTFDWQMRFEERQQFLRQLDVARMPHWQEQLPLDVDDLFNRVPSVDSEDALPPTVSDCRHFRESHDEAASSSAPTRLGTRTPSFPTVAEDAPLGSDGDILVEPSAEDSNRTATGHRCRRSVHAKPAFREEFCTRLHEIMLARSWEATLVVINLPDLWGTEREEVLNFMLYCDTLTRGMPRVLFVHSTDHEIFDLYRS